MNIIELRLGHATNSSSSHSIVKAGTSNCSKRNNIPHEYGWENFLLSTPDEKRAYLSQMLHSQLRYEFGLQIASIVCDELFGHNSYAPLGFVDHNSCFIPPVSYENRKIALEFYKELTEAIANDNTVEIAGGNDNSEGNEGVESDDWKWVQQYSYPHDKVVSRVTNKIWRYYNPASGTKMYLDFSKSSPIVKGYEPEYPELIDVKITDYCDSGCAFCYQSSTTKGKHADLGDIVDFAMACKKYKVLEVAIGGGEPTKHPEFGQILEIFKQKKIMANFSTRNYSGFHNFCGEGAVGISISSEKDLEQISKINFPSYKKVIHYIPDMYSLDNLERILSKINYGTILLLGYKGIGRGKNANIILYHHKNVFTILKKYPSVSVSIDTKFANDYSKELAKTKISEKLYKTKEGIHSCYVDLVKKQYGISSYETNLHSFDKMKDIFANWKGNNAR